MVEFTALGGLAVTESGEPVPIGGPRQRRLLAMLLIHANSVVSVDRLADAVFAGEPTPAANTTMRSYIARIRRVVDNGHEGGPRSSPSRRGTCSSCRRRPWTWPASRPAWPMLAPTWVGRTPPEAAAEARAALELWQSEAFAVRTPSAVGADHRTVRLPLGSVMGPWCSPRRPPWWSWSPECGRPRGLVGRRRWWPDRSRRSAPPRGRSGTPGEPP